MSQLHLLSAGANSAEMPFGSDTIPLIIGAIGLLLVIAFCIGFAKGVRKVSWSGLVWAGSIALFAVVNGKIGEELLHNSSITITTAAGEVYDLSALILFAVAVLCVLAVLIVYGIFSLLLRGKGAKRKAVQGPRKYDVFGQEYEADDDLEYDEDYESTKARENAEPSFLGRLLGGLFCIINFVMIIAVVLCIAVVIIDSTGLKNSLTSLYEITLSDGSALMPMLADIAKQWGMDALAIGIMIYVSSVGKKKGLMESLRTLFMQVGNIVLVAFAFYVPFSAFVAGPDANTEGWLYQFVKYFVDLMYGSMGESMSKISPIVGQLVSGVLLAVIVSSVMMILNVIWRKLNFKLRRASFLRSLDGTLSCVVYLVIGAVAVVGLWAVLTALDVFNVIDATSLYNESAPISYVIHNVCRVFIEPFLQGISILG